MSSKSHRLQIEYRHVSELQPYKNNPRLNETAVPAVMQSILDFGFRVPVIVDTEGTIVAGHTRVLAVQRIIAEDPTKASEYQDIPILVASDLNPEQLQAFRLVDNKVAEIATWDFDLLAEEVAALNEVGITLTGYGWTQEEIDCLHNVVSIDCLTDTPKVPGEGDGLSTPLFKGRGLNFTLDGSAVRISFGTLAFMVGREDFEAWNADLHKKHNFNAEAVIEEVAGKLGLLEAKHRRDLARGTLTPEAAEAVVETQAV